MTSMSHANSTAPIPFPKRKHGMHIRRFVLKLLHLCVPTQDVQDFGRYDDGIDSDSRDDLRPSGRGDWHEIRVRPVRGRKVNDSCELYRKKSGRRSNDEHENGLSGERKGGRGKHVAFQDVEAPPLPISCNYGADLRSRVQHVAAFVLTQADSTIALKSLWSDSSSSATSGTRSEPQNTTPTAPPLLYQGPQQFPEPERLHRKQPSAQQAPVPPASSANTAQSRLHHPQAPLRPHLASSERITPPSPTASPQSRIQEHFRRSTQSEKARQLVCSRVGVAQVNMTATRHENEKDQYESVTIRQEQTQDLTPASSSYAHMPDGSLSRERADVGTMRHTPVGVREEVRMMKELMGEISVTVSSSSDEGERTLPTPTTKAPAEQQTGDMDEESSNRERLFSRSTSPQTPLKLAMRPSLPQLTPPPPHLRHPDGAVSPIKIARPRRSPRKVPISPRPDSDGADYDTPVLRTITFMQTPDGEDVVGHVDAGYAAYLGCQTEMMANMTLYGVKGPKVHWGVCERRDSDLEGMAIAAQSIMRKDEECTMSTGSKKRVRSPRVKKEEEEVACGVL